MKSLKIRTKNLYFASLYYCDGCILKRVGLVPVKRSAWGKLKNGVESYKNVVTREIYPDAFEIFGPIINGTEKKYDYDYKIGAMLTTKTIDKEWATKNELKHYCKKLIKSLDNKTS